MRTQKSEISDSVEMPVPLKSTVSSRWQNVSAKKTLKKKAKITILNQDFRKQKIRTFEAFEEKELLTACDERRSYEGWYIGYMTIENVIEILRTVTGDSLHKYKAQIKGIFGSFARGEESESSDIDVLVDFKEDADLFDLVGLSLFLEEKLKRPVDIVPTDTIKGDIRNIILKEAIYI